MWKIYISKYKLLWNAYVDLYLKLVQLNSVSKLRLLNSLQCCLSLFLSWAYYYGGLTNTTSSVKAKYSFLNHESIFFTLTCPAVSHLFFWPTPQVLSAREIFSLIRVKRTHLNLFPAHIITGILLWVHSKQLKVNSCKIVGERMRCFESRININVQLYCYDKHSIKPQTVHGGSVAVILPLLFSFCRPGSHFVWKFSQHFTVNMSPLLAISHFCQQREWE